MTLRVRPSGSPVPYGGKPVYVLRTRYANRTGLTSRLQKETFLQRWLTNDKGQIIGN
ncbi:MAG: hypothetical protein KME57_20810 [Scytonema hyalinum WJT4-NPBG1]|nr:hypothetical protein [Scytonema hyalinum WJT4-NPBG1]